MAATQNDIQRLIECCICCDYLTDVRETPCCHQLFCHACILSWLQTSTKNCPRCRSTALTEHNLTKNYVIERFVDNLEFDCPHKLQGCPAKIPRCDLPKHKRLCSYSPEKLARKNQEKLAELQALLRKYKAPRSRVTDKALFDLAILFHAEHQYAHARECLTLIKTKKKVPEMVVLQARIERDDGHYDKALELYTQAYASASLIPERTELLLDKGHIYIKTAQYGQAKDTFKQALDLLEDDDRSQKKAEILNAFGLVAKKCSEYDQAISAYNDALEIVDTNSDVWSEIISNLADIHRKKANYNEARDLYLKSLKQMESIYGQNHPSIADIMNNLGMLSKKEGKYIEALDYLKQAIKISKHYYGDEHPSIGIYLTNIGDIYRKQSDFKTAEGTYKEAITALEKAFGPNHIEVAEVLNSMGLVLKKRADYDGAQSHYERAIRIVHSTFGEDQEHYKLGVYYNNLADVYRKRNQFDTALQLYARALTSIEKTLGPQHSEAAEILHNIGQVQHQLGNYKEAIDYINRALAIVRKEFGDKHYKYGMFLNSLGLTYAMIDDYTTAYEHIKQALQILLTALGGNHVEVCDVYSNLGDVCMKLVAESDQQKTKNKNPNEKQSKLDEAKKYYTEAQRIAQATFGAEHTKSKQFLSLLFIVDNYNSL
ncbi:unnamed protein product [Rotaria socialis]|uniref:RING-type domain-containing protein n=1 Tax=Rotaria socialis TaxID=392032 RepID=A0A818L6S7_9BILA|nr:unnamed protein product [Rotaria socialis]CAF3185658.1 unnamed protein product [Rotaria socialis]CAF3565358.1 unnamed protein product [Rotaria socialis]CAF3716441.1 unnamed protein product [Rotaria socialis]CAF4368354.1 unnamed protein product [Rotaria socialis]